MSSKRFSHAQQTTVHSPKKETQPTHVQPRKKRRDAGKRRFTKRDRSALLWIGHQYGIRLDHLQQLLGRSPGHGARYKDWISESAARDVVTRWEQEGWVHGEYLQVGEPFWVWSTRKLLRQMGLTYAYRNLKASKVDDLEHLYAINTIRLDVETDEPGVHWMSERELLRGRLHIKGNVFLHRPDSVVRLTDGQTVAIEAELSAKKPRELDENLLELLRGEEYLRAKGDVGVSLARTMSRFDRSSYDQIWYFAPKTIRKQVRRARAKLVADEVISEEEAERIYVLWYPLALMDEERLLEAREDDAALGLDSE